MKFTVTEKKQRNMRRIAKMLLDQSREVHGFVSAKLLASFCGKSVSLTLAVPLARYYTRSLYTAMSHALHIQGGTKVKLSRIERRDLLFWRKLGPEGSFLLNQKNNFMHTFGCSRLGRARHVERAHEHWSGRQGDPGYLDSSGQSQDDCLARTQSYAPDKREDARSISTKRSTKSSWNRITTLQRRRRSRIKAWVDNAAVFFIVRSIITE